MITIYLKQSYNLLKENRFVNGISIAGTCLLYTSDAADD